MADALPDKIREQIAKRGLPRTGTIPFDPKIRTNLRGCKEIEKAEVGQGPKKGKKGYVDSLGRIWIRDWAHAGIPDHWDVQIDDGRDYIRVDDQGNEIAGRP